MMRWDWQDQQPWQHFWKEEIEVMQFAFEKEAHAYFDFSYHGLYLVEREKYKNTIFFVVLLYH